MRALGISCLVVVAGCGGSARPVVHDAHGGLLALDGDRGAARQDADRRMAEHCGAGGARVVFEGEVSVRDEDTHERSREDRIAQASIVAGGDHTTWVEGTSPYGESGVTFAVDGDPALYDTGHAARHETHSSHMETRVEYECEDAGEGDGE